jgi:ribosome-binding factor A
MTKLRTDRLNSLLKEVIAEVIYNDVRNPHLTKFVSVTRVEITKDLHYAKVYISVLGTEQDKRDSLLALQSAAGFIAVHASKKVVMRYFPELTFKLDDSLDKHIRIQELLGEISAERESREKDPNEEDASEEESSEEEQDSEHDDHSES